MRYFLTRAKVEGFRGINNESEPLEVKFDKDKVNSVFAVNGTGKSSLYDALCYAITGSLSKLDKLHPIEHGEDYYVNRFHGQGIATIELELTTDEPTPHIVLIKVVRNADGTRHVSSPSGAPDPQSILDTLNDSFTLLDYHTFNTFIDHSPLDRGRSFSTLLGLDVYSDFRQSLKTAIDTRSLRADLDLPTLEAEVDTYTNTANIALGRMDTAYGALTGDSVKDVTKLDEYAIATFNAVVGIEILKPVTESKALETLDFQEISKAIKEAEGGKDKDKLASLIASLIKLQAVGIAGPIITDEQNQIKVKMEEAERLLASTAGTMRKKLYAAAEHLVNEGGWHDENTCPLCSSDLDRPIAEIVTEQQQQYAEYDAKLEELKTAWRGSQWRDRVNKLEQTVGMDLPEEERLFSGFDQKMREGGSSQADVTTIKAHYARLEIRYEKALESYETQKTDLEKKLPPSLVQLTEQVENVRLFREYLNDYRSNIAKAEASRKKLELRKKWQTYIGNTARVFAKAEADLSKAKLATIDAEYKDMFASIMAARDIVPNLQRDSSREDLYVQLADFHGLHDVSAKPLLSESFRNALAISVYLSAALKHAGSPRFIVLDDITSSFDSSHQLNLIEYIRTKLQYGPNPNGVQFIIMTHDGVMQKYFEGMPGDGNVKHQVLEGYPPGGLAMRGKSPSRIRQVASDNLNAGQLDAGGPWVRMYLECILMMVIRKVQIPVPIDFAIKDHKRMVSNCLEAINEAVDVHEHAGDLILDVTQRADMKNTYVPSILANYVSHYETGSGAAVTPAMLLSILQSIDDFANCFKYNFNNPATGRLERRFYKSLTAR
jgi:DNA repair exonuclease SbcCD ATPase subunit